MTILQKILIANFLFNLINCTCTSYLKDDSVDFVFGNGSMTGMNYKDSSASTKNCQKRTFNEAEKSFNAYKCCYVKTKCKYSDFEEETDVKGEFEGCVAIDKNSYDNIKKLKEQYSKNCEKADIKCSGTSLSYAYLMLIILFLL